MIFESVVALRTFLRWGVAKWKGSGLWSRLSEVRILPPQLMSCLGPDPYARATDEQSDRVNECPVGEGP